MPMLEREEYIEQAYFFRALGERMKQNLSTQDLLASLKEELLSTTKLPLALDFLASELRLHGVIGPAMERLPHYFTPFQTFVMTEAENERSRFSFDVALEVLRRQAEYLAQAPAAQGVFLFQFETICRNRLGYDRGLTSMAGDPAYDADWREFIRRIRGQIAIVDIADLIYVHSRHYVAAQEARAASGRRSAELPPAVLFGEKEGKIALANRRRDPLLLFAALQRHLNYPLVPKPQRPDATQALLPSLARRLERLEMRLKLLEEEARGGIDLSRFQPPPEEPRELTD